MYIEMPNEFIISLNFEEKRVIKECCTILTLIEEEVAKHNCSEIITEDDEIITYGHIEDIIIQLNLLVEAHKMY